jgi:hypothetical protein
MSSAVPLILSEEPVTRTLLARMKVSKPNIAVVYADAFGQVAYFGGRPLSWAEQVRSRYRTRYEVDLSDHRRTAQLDSSPLPSLGDVYFFRSTVDVGFRVTEPTAVVRRHVTDALPVVYNYLIDAFRPVTRRHEIGDAQGAEADLNLLFQHPVALEEGITIYRCTTRLLPDHAAQQYLHPLETADRSLAVGEAQHRVATAASRQEHELASMAQEARLHAESREHEAMAGQTIDLHGLIRAHLAKHPDETSYALELLARHEQAQLVSRDINDNRSMDLFRYMIEQGLIQAAARCPWTPLTGRAGPARRRSGRTLGRADGWIWSVIMPCPSCQRRPSSKGCRLLAPHTAGSSSAPSGSPALTGSSSRTPPRSCGSAATPTT